VRLLAGYRLPQVEVTIAYPSRHHLPAKVRTFIDHLVEHFSQMSTGLPGDPAALQEPALRPAQMMQRTVAEMEANAPEFDDIDEAASLQRGKAAAAPAPRKAARSARMIDQATAAGL
jgi:hypothetical protein